MNYSCYNGKMMAEGSPLLQANDRSYRYGDGLFETMKVVKDKILLEEYHLERLLSGMKLLKFKVPVLFTPEKINKEITGLCKKNKCDGLARVRLSASRGSGSLYDGDDALQYLIECWPLGESVNKFNENGLVMGIYPDAKKSCDSFSNLKSANYLPYVMAAQYAKENKWNDCLVLNQHGRICDATIANVFWIKDRIIFTPPLSEGCVAGVMRRYLIEKAQGTTHKVQEKELGIEELEKADEIFLTNAIYGIRWARQFRNKVYQDKISATLFKELVLPLY